MPSTRRGYGFVRRNVSQSRRSERRRPKRRSTPSRASGSFGNLYCGGAAECNGCPGVIAIIIAAVRHSLGWPTDVDYTEKTIFTKEDTP
jgi:hypothetical protein